MTSQNNRAPVLCYAIAVKLCALFQIHRWIQTRVIVRRPSNRVKIGDFLPRATLKFDEWPWKAIGHLLCATSSFVHHFIAIGEFKLELQSGNAQIGAKLVLTSVTLTFDLWPWPFAWTSLLSMVITFENFGRADGQTDGRRDRSVLLGHS